MEKWKCLSSWCDWIEPIDLNIIYWVWWRPTEKGQSKWSVAIILATKRRRRRGRKFALYSPKIWKPFDQLSRIVFVEFDVWEVHLKHGRTGISHPEEHQFRFAQMHRCQCCRVHGSQGKHLLFSNKLFDFFGFVIFISFSKWLWFCLLDVFFILLVMLF